MAERVDRIGVVREHLQLEDEEVFCAGKRRRFQATQVGQVTCEFAGRCRLLGEIP